MSQDSFFYWGVFVTLFLFIAALLTVRQMFENRMLDKQEKLQREQQARDVAESNSGL